MGFIKNKKFIIFLIILGVFCIGQVVFAKELAAGWPPSPFGTKLDEKSEIPAFIGYLYEWGISIGGLAVFIALLIAGFQYLSSIGNPATMREAKDRIISALLGLALLLGSWLILNTINPQLTKLQLPPFEPGEILPITASTITNTFDPDEMKNLEELKPCEGAKITRARKDTITLTVTTCRGFTAAESIITDELFTVTGYDKENATSCIGYVVLYATGACNTRVGAYTLETPAENTHVDADAHGTLFFSSKK